RCDTAGQSGWSLARKKGVLATGLPHFCSAIDRRGRYSSQQGSARDNDGLMVTALRRHEPLDLPQANPAKVFSELAAQEWMRQAAVVANRPPLATAAHDEQMLIVGPAIPMPMPVLKCQAHVTRCGRERLGRE